MARGRILRCAGVWRWVFFAACGGVFTARGVRQRCFLAAGAAFCTASVLFHVKHWDLYDFARKTQKSPLFRAKRWRADYIAQGAGLILFHVKHYLADGAAGKNAGAALFHVKGRCTSLVPRETRINPCFT